MGPHKIYTSVKILLKLRFFKKLLQFNNLKIILCLTETDTVIIVFQFYNKMGYPK